MSDEDEQPDPFQAMFFGQIPEEARQQMEQQHQMHEMAVEVWRHEVRDFLQGLKAEQMRTLRRLMAQFQNEEYSTGLASYYVGVLSTLLEMKFGACLACNKNHDEDLAVAVQENLDAQRKPDDDGSAY